MKTCFQEQLQEQQIQQLIQDQQMQSSLEQQGTMQKMVNIFSL